MFAIYSATWPVYGKAVGAGLSSRIADYTARLPSAAVLYRRSAAGLRGPIPATFRNERSGVHAQVTLPFCTAGVAESPGSLGVPIWLICAR